jgi:hypothetical protein
MDAVVGVKARAPPQDDKLVLGTAMIEVIGGEDPADDEAEAILIPSDDGDQGLKTLTQDLECKSHTRNVPSSDPLASKTALFPLLLEEEDAKSAGSNNAREVTALT